MAVICDFGVSWCPSSQMLIYTIGNLLIFNYLIPLGKKVFSIS
jgi:hypothetical protein